MKTMAYKGYKGTIEYSEEDKCYYGKLLDINGLEMYEGSTLEKLEEDFKESVRDYAAFLKESKTKAV